MSENKASEGITSGSYEELATAERLELFRSAVGASSAVPTFLTVCRQGEFELLTQVGIPIRRILHTEQEYLYQERVIAGDRLVYRTQLAQVLAKGRGERGLQFLTFVTEIDIHRGDQELKAGQAKTTIVVRP